MPKPEWIYGVWFLPWKNEPMDLLIKLLKVESKWVLEWRFRYYDPDSTDPHDGKDHKSHYAMQAPDDSDDHRDRAVQAINEMLTRFEPDAGHKADFVLLDCSEDDPKVLFEIGSRPWAHLKKISKEQAKEMGLCDEPTDI